MSRCRKLFVAWVLLAFGALAALATIVLAQEPGAVEQKETRPVAISTAPETKPANRLIHETSPYLLQHAHNPVDWYPWGDEALARARDENRPIFLSVGYSACHWCHVMEEESFENEEIAAIMNAHFVCIKVDREERPDIDDIYMMAVQAMTGSGGWPMSVFLTPDLEPFYGGTYFPPEDKFGRPGFKNVLLKITEVWETERDKVLGNSAAITKHLRELTARSGSTGEVDLDPDLLAQAAGQLNASLDRQSGGFGPAPKFPSAPSNAILLRQHAITGEDHLLEAAVLTLDRMAEGGLFDHLGGGFHRYSTDAEWLVPHFEKMLYDNAQLSQAYIEAYQATGEVRFRCVAEAVFTYVLRDMQHPNGPFYSSEDADSEGEEGKFYLWTRDEILSVLGEKDGEVFCQYYNVKPNGNFTSPEPYHGGKNILHVSPGTAPPDDLATMREKLLAVRSERVRPGLDDKILTSWNALMISAFARGHQALGNPEYRLAAERAARFILTEMRKDGVLLRSYRKGPGRVPGYLDDYAFLIVALEDLYEATFDPAWLDAADELAQAMVSRFWDEEGGGFFFDAADHTNLLFRTKPTQDGAEPSGNSVAAIGLLRLAILGGNTDYRAKAERAFSLNASDMSRAPRAFLSMLCAVHFLQDPPKEIAIVGPPDSPVVNGFLEAVHKRFIPNKVVVLLDPAAGDKLGDRIPLLESKGLIDGNPAVYVCKDFVCRRPVTTVEGLVEVIDEPVPAAN